MRCRTHPPIRTGTLTILITLVAVCLAVLSVLSFSTSHADLVLAKNSLQRYYQDTALQNQAQHWLQSVDQSLFYGYDIPLGEINPNGSISTTLTDSNGRCLAVSVTPSQTQNSPRYRITRWQFSQLWEPDTSLNLWDGIL